MKISPPPSPFQQKPRECSLVRCGNLHTVPHSDVCLKHVGRPQLLFFCRQLLFFYRPLLFFCPQLLFFCRQLLFFCRQLTRIQQTSNLGAEIKDHPVPADCALSCPFTRADFCFKPCLLVPRRFSLTPVSRLEPLEGCSAGLDSSSDSVSLWGPPALCHHRGSTSPPMYSTACSGSPH